MSKTEREEFENKWSEEDQRRTAIMRKMKWSDARMGKYEKYCSEHKDGVSDDLFEWIILPLIVLILFATYYIFENTFKRYSNIFGILPFIGLFVIALLVALMLPLLLTWLRSFHYKHVHKLPIFIPSKWPAIQDKEMAEARRAVEYAAFKIRSAQFYIRSYVSPRWISKAKENAAIARTEEKQAMEILSRLEEQAVAWHIELTKRYAKQSPRAVERAVKLQDDYMEQSAKWHTEQEEYWANTAKEDADGKAEQKLREEENQVYREKLYSEWQAKRKLIVEAPVPVSKPKLPVYDPLTLRPTPSAPPVELVPVAIVPIVASPPLVTTVESSKGALGRILERGPIVHRKEPDEFIPPVEFSGIQDLVEPEPEPTYPIGDERFAPPPGFRIRVHVESVHVPELAPELATVLEPGLIELDPGFVPEPAPESELALEPGSEVESEPELTPKLVFEAAAKPVPAPPHTQTLPPKEPEPDEWEPANLTRTRTPRAKAEPEFDPEPAIEGRRKLRTNYAVVRNPKLRIMAIQIHGRSCCVCGFNFDAFFGKELARGYIEVHHLNNVASGERTTDPVTDLAPLCANCHAMADRLTLNQESPPRSIAQLRELLIPSSNDRTNDESSTDDE